MPLMGSLYVGTSGLQTSQNALHTTAHNLSNIDTTGYTRQQVVQADKSYNTVGTAYISKPQTGLGVSYAKVRQVRDFFLDKSYRLEASRYSYYDNSYKIATEVEVLFGEMEGVEFQEALTDMKTAIQELQKDPANATNQGLLVSKANSFIERAQAVYNGLASYQNTLNVQIEDTVDQINDIGKKIWNLNQKIIGIEASNQEEANDLRDARNDLLDQLAGLAKIDYSEDVYGAVTVQIEGVDFVTRGYVSPLEIERNEKTGFVDVVWQQNSDFNGNKIKVFNLERDIASETNTDTGGLKALLILRGSDRGTYRDIPVAPDKQDYPKDIELTYERAVYLHKRGILTGAVGAETDYPKDVTVTYSQAAQIYEDDVNTYNRTVNKSLLQNTMAEFDKLINGIVTGMNEILNPTKDENGDPLTETKGINLFLRNNIDEQKTTDMPDDEDADEPITWWTTANLKVNPLLLQQYAYLGSTRKPDGTYTGGFMTLDGKENRTKADSLKGLFDNDFAPLNPNVSNASNFMSYYNNMVGELATTGNVYKNMSETQRDTADSIDSARQQVVGVSDNEELTNMIMYQNAYNASSRYINAINEMLGHIIQTLGT